MRSFGDMSIKLTSLSSYDLVNNKDNGATEPRHRNGIPPDLLTWELSSLSDWDWYLILLRSDGEEKVKLYNN